ncbi:hypothetical protein [Flavobacterium xinjiangense]|uniref:Uncharacterized protein n=1 Tax=Flavobacterium xinjiangense TaxID=178356 RepID=A0A1M7PUF5_9FLAO|nr:hypothetical protein [Flavobacterium xinjiangense]SHN21088.1 hypothetical protein SAMN05216269_12313 [Flavobacterium xinjiangense]
MTIQDLQKKIDEIATYENIDQQEIINGIMANLEIKYKKANYSEEDKKLIEELKTKILTKLYSLPEHKKLINHMTKFDELFGLDKLEFKLLNNAFNELEAEGDVYSLEYEIGLKEQGIRKTRK